MVIPIGDEPNPRDVPYVTWALIAVNVAVYVLVSLPLSATPLDPRSPAVLEYLNVLRPALGDDTTFEAVARHLSAYDIFVFTHGFRPAHPSMADLLLSLFLHAGLLHLAGNMLFLWIYGDNVEHRLGGGRYLLVYLGTGITATAVHGLLAPESNIPTIGASGAISGILGCYFVWFPHNQVRLLWLLPPLFLNVFLVPARVVLGLYILAENLLPFLLTREATGVAYGAHIGGFLAGLGLAWWIGHRALVRPPHEYPQQRRGMPPGEGTGDALEQMHRLAAAGRLGEAAAAYFSLPGGAVRALDPEEGLALAHWLRSNGHSAAAMTVLRRLLRDFPQGPSRAETHVAAGYMLLEDMEQPTAAYQHFLDALDLDPEPALAALARDGLAAVQALQQRSRWSPPHGRRA